MFKTKETKKPSKQKCPHFLEAELIHLVAKAKYMWLIVGQLPIKKLDGEMLPSGSGILAEAINMKKLTKNQPDPRIPTLIPCILTPVPCIPTLIPRIPNTPTPIPHIPTPIPHIPTLILHIPTLIPHVHTLIPCVPTLIPRVPTLISGVPTLIPRVPIIPLILFSNSPFWFLEIANKV